MANYLTAICLGELSSLSVSNNHVNTGMMWKHEVLQARLDPTPAAQAQHVRAHALNASLYLAGQCLILDRYKKKKRWILNIKWPVMNV